jgi:choline kinase
MTAVVLAAGIASRLRPLTDNTPKSLLVVDGKSLLQRTLESLQRGGIQRCVIVTGYLNEMIESFVSSMQLSMTVEFVWNSEFSTTNNNYSLWLSQAAVNGDGILLLDADILFDERILTRLITSPHEDALIMRRSSQLHIGKHLNPPTSVGESLGMERFSPQTTQRLYEVLSRRRIINEFYEASFQEVIDCGAKIFAVDSGGFPCMEIDTPEDLVAAETLAQQLP